MKILVAGIGNIFLGDDGFGVEVARELARRPLPSGVQVSDFGIRSFDLAYALDSADLIILVDAVSRGSEPGTLYEIEPDLENLGEARAQDPHAMDPVAVLQLARQMQVNPGRIVLLGCEPESFGPDEGALGLSPLVQAAVGRAAEWIEAIIVRELDAQGVGVRK
jgi:hydrogenase maturation protease